MRFVLPLALAASAAAHAAQPCAADTEASLAYMGRAVAAARELQVPADYPRTHHLRLAPEAAALADAGRDIYGRPLRLEPQAAAALAVMMGAARRQGIVLRAVSGYRSFDRQRHLVQDKLRRGMPIDEALRINTAPGFSEHHSGCAVDLATPGSAPVEAGFMDTPAYRWLIAHAGAYGFHLSYPAGNPHGIEFEPWHWRFTGRPRAVVLPRVSAALPGNMRADAGATSPSQAAAH